MPFFKYLLTLAPVLLYPGQTVAVAQKTSAAEEFSIVQALYYTPTANGLQSFHCNVTLDWKEFLERTSGKSVTDDAPGLVYLRSVQMTLDDDLRTGGALKWDAPAPPPQEVAGGIEKIHSGMVKTWSGFFQTWNNFMNGYMVSVTDTKTAVERNEEGFRLVAKEEESLVEEQYDKNHLLEYMHVVTPAVEMRLTPTYADSPQGRIVKVLHTSYHQPPTAPATDMTMKVEYATVSGFQLPSELQVEIQNLPYLRFQMSGCSVKTVQTSAKKP